MTKLMADLRQDYQAEPLIEQSIASDPIQQFGAWFQEAVEAGIREPNAMTVATCDPQGNPSARMVLLKEFDGRGFVFYTNYDSRKGHELNQNPRAALVWWWPDLERQVRVEGTVERLSVEESDAYFQERPLKARQGAWASPQSQVIPHREHLRQLTQEVEQRYPEEVPRPPHWGGLRIKPEMVEFWQGRSSRLHDRLRFRRQGADWVLERLAP